MLYLTLSGRIPEDCGSEKNLSRHIRVMEILKVQREE